MRRVTSNRRSLETDTESERSSKLDPLPEEKFSVTSPEPQKRGPTDWKPSVTLNSTDVVKTIEALAGKFCLNELSTDMLILIIFIMNPTEAQPRDKSAVRKSNLNVSNSSEETETDRRFRRQKSRETPVPSTTLQSIVEEDKRKSYIQSLGDRPPSDKLQIYIRRPSEDIRTPTKEEIQALKSPITESNDSKNKQSIYIRPLSQTDPAAKQSIYIRGSTPVSPTSPSGSASLSTVLDSVETPNVPKRIRRPIVQDEPTNNKIEIDSDNIETPPSERKTFKTENKGATNLVRRVNRWQPLPIDPPAAGGSVTKTTLNASTNEFELGENEILGDGQFDRYASARKTRRFKRPTDHSSSTEEKSTTSPESPLAESKNISLIQKMTENVPVVEAPQSPIKEKDNKIKRWPDRLGSKPPISTLSETPDSGSKSDVVSRIEKIGRKMSRISQEDVREAIRSLKSPTPEREWAASKEFGLRDRPTPVKAITHELNDEGFEETQSLVSDTPSHGKDSTSSCNENSEKVKRNKPRRLISSDSAATTGSDTSKRKSSGGKPLPLQGLLSRNQQSLERSKSVRGAPPVLVNKNLLPKRTNSLRRIDSPISNAAINANRLDVERSNSRTSLRSSRSSINSAVSTNTVKKMPLRSQQTSITSSSPLSIQSKRPLVTQNSPVKTPVRVPASRSSSSGSSIGPTINKKPPVRVSSIVNTSFKENQNSSTNRITRTTPQKSITSSTNNLSSTPTTRNHFATKTMSNRNSAPSGTGTATGAAPARTSSFMRPTAASTTKVKGK